MPALTNEAAVRNVLSTSLTSGQVQAFIDDAHLWVSEELGSVGLSPERMELIERYLACALVRLRDLGLKSASIKDISEQYQVDSEITDYLKRAASFDPTGKLAEAFLPEADGSRTVKFRVGGGFKADLGSEG